MNAFEDRGYGTADGFTPSNPISTGTLLQDMAEQDMVEPHIPRFGRYLQKEAPARQTIDKIFTEIDCFPSCLREV